MMHSHLWGHLRTLEENWLDCSAPCPISCWQKKSHTKTHTRSHRQGNKYPTNTHYFSLSCIHTCIFTGHAHIQRLHTHVCCVLKYICVYSTHTNKSDEVASLVPPTGTLSLSLINHTPAVCLLTCVVLLRTMKGKKKSPSPFLLHHASFFFQSCVPSV